MTVEKLITDHIDIWSSALQTRSTAGRGSNGKIDLYGIKKLRELILELAVRGKLVPQDPNDEPASELLKRIAAEKAELMKQGKIKKLKPLPEISEDEKPFELPVGWQWEKLGNICSKLTDGSHNPPKDNGSGYPMLSSQNIQNGLIDFNNPSRYVCEDAFIKENGRTLVKKDDILLTIVGSLGRSAVVNDNTKFALQRSVAVLTTGLYSSYLSDYFKSMTAQLYFIENGKGTAQKGIYLGQLSQMLVPVPSLAEQKRIVYNIQELMSLCDQLEQQSLTSLEAHQQLVETLLATLTESQNAEELAENWARISQHFDTLFTTEASIDALKQTILQLAVMGKLTEQEKANTSECKTSLIDGLSIYDDINERIPKTWSLSKLDNISSAIIDCPHSTPKWADKGFICVRTNQIKRGYLDLNDSRHVSEQTYIERIQRLEPSFNDILYSREGGVLGVACRIPAEVKVCLGQRMMLIRSGDRVLPEYLEIVLNSPLITILARQMTTGGAAPRINVSTVKNYLIPLPPKKEQYQIIARVKELLNLGDTLKSRLQSVQQTQFHLADALTDAALN